MYKRQAINYQNNSLGRNYDIFAANYGPSAFGRIGIGTALSGSFGSFERSVSVGGGITILPGDYIGIYVEDSAGGGTAAPPVIIEGTIYYSLKP